MKTMPPAKRVLTLTVRPEWEGRTVKSLLRSELHMTDGLIARVKLRETGLCRNGERCRTVDRVRAGDVLAAEVGDGPEEKNTALPIAVPLKIVYEDEDLAVIDKAPGMVVHGVSGGAPTLANALAALWGEEQPFHPVHRLDRGTSGLLVAAKSAYIQERLRRMLHTEDFRREYLAVVNGVMEMETGIVDLPIGRDPGHPPRRRIDPGGQAARTEYAVEKRLPGATVLRVRPLTGRTHQIRVHMAALGHPLVGDVLYGGGEGLERPALHSAGMRLRHPVTGEWMELAAPLPEDMGRLLI